MVVESDQQWYVVKQADGHCSVVSHSQLPTQIEQPPLEQWGPFESQSVAIARRVGLIRSGKCQPN